MDDAAESERRRRKARRAAGRCWEGLQRREHAQDTTLKQSPCGEQGLASEDVNEAAAAGAKLVVLLSELGGAFSDAMPDAEGPAARRVIAVLGPKALAQRLHGSLSLDRPEVHLTYSLYRKPK